MTDSGANLVKRLLGEKDYAGLEGHLAEMKAPAMAVLWPQLSALEKLVVFKLLDAVRAMELFGVLPFSEKYFLFGAFPLQAIAPVLEDLPAARRRSFVQLPREDCDRMFRQLLDAGASA